MLSVIIVCKKNNAEISLFFSASYHRITNYVSVSLSLPLSWHSCGHCLLCISRVVVILFRGTWSLSSCASLVVLLDSLISSLTYRKLLDGKEGQRTSTRGKRGEEEEVEGKELNWKRHPTCQDEFQVSFISVADKQHHQQQLAEEHIDSLLYYFRSVSLSLPPSRILIFIPVHLRRRIFAIEAEWSIWEQRNVR